MQDALPAQAAAADQRPADRAGNPAPPAIPPSGGADGFGHGAPPVQAAAADQRPADRAENPAHRSIPPSGVAYGFGIGALAVGLSLPLLLHLRLDKADWLQFALIAAGAAIAQLFVVRHTHR